MQPQAPHTDATARKQPTAALTADAGTKRIVAVGDLHGDDSAARQVLRLASLIDEQDHWSGGRAQLVQLGDFLDRGDGERAIMSLFDRLAGEARAAGGAVHVLNGNHELMNAARRFLYVTPKGFSAFSQYDDGDATLTILPKHKRGRFAAFRPGGDYAQKLARYPVVLQLGSTVFVHGGLLPKHIKYGVERINRRARDFLLGRDDKAWGWFAEWDSPVNSRHYADHPNDADCLLLQKTLRALGAERMVVGHTVQLGGLRSYCNNKVWATDVGLSSCCGDKREALELRVDRSGAVVTQVLR